MKITIAPPQALYEQGRRPNQEDAMWPAFGQAATSDRLFIVCDGMGGHDHGEVASLTVAETVGSYISDRLPEGLPLTDSLLADAIDEAYRQLDSRDTPGDSRKMGTTLTLLCLHRGGATMAHIGDSRIYHLRPERKPSPALFVSRDHSLVMELYLSGELTWDETKTYEGKNVITRAMQPHQERRYQPDIVHTTDLRPGDLFLLCSDGVIEQLTDSQLYDILTADTTDEQRCQHLRDATATASDNHSAYMVRIANVLHEPQDNSALHNEDKSRANLMNLLSMHETEDPSSLKPTEKPKRNALKRLLSKWF